LLLPSRMSVGQRRVCVPTASGWSCVSREIYKVEQRKIPRYSRVSYHQKRTRTQIILKVTVSCHRQNYLSLVPAAYGCLGNSKRTLRFLRLQRGQRLHLWCIGTKKPGFNETLCHPANMFLTQTAS